MRFTHPVAVVGRRVVWGFLDQAVSSLTNFALAIFVARSVSLSEFGAFAITLAAYYVASGVGQAVVAQPLAINYSARSQPAFARVTSMAAGTSLSLGLIAGAAIAASTFFLPRVVGAPLLVLGATLPGLLLQDCWRFAFVTFGRPRSAAANDLLWAAMQGVGFALLSLLHVRNSSAYVAMWGSAATVAALFGCFQARTLPNLTQTLAWLKLHRGLAFRYTLESLIVRGSTQASLGLIGLIAGLSALGAVRGAQLLFSPLNLIYLSAFLIAVPEAVRILNRAPARFLQVISGLSGTSSLVAILWTVPLLLLPSEAGRALLGATWASAQALIPAVALQNVAIGITMGPQVGLRSFAAADLSLKSQAAYACFVLTSTAVGAGFAGAQGAAVGIAVGTLLGAAVWWPMFLSRAKRQSIDTETASPSSLGRR